MNSTPVHDSAPLTRTSHPRRSIARRILAIACLAALCGGPVLAADPFPNRPVRIIVTSAPGGFLDITTRLVARHLGERLGQPFIVENRVGAGGLVAIRAAKAAPADGYTVLAVLNTVAIQQAVSSTPNYDVLKDFVGIGAVARSPFLLVTGGEQPDASAADLVARARSTPGKLSYASAGSGSTTHVGAALFAQRAGVNMVHVPYKGNAAAWPDVVAGRVGVILEAYGSAISMVREGRLKVLGTTATQRMDVLPSVPTMAEQGIPNYSFYLWMGLLAPTGTPPEVVQKLSVALKSVLALPELKARFRDEGAEAMPMSQEDFGRFLQDEVHAIARLVSDLSLPRE